MRITGLSILFLIAITSLQCKKDSSPPPAVDVPGTITITFPTAGTILDNGFLLKVEGEMADNNTLTQARVEVKNKNTGALLYQASSNTGNVNFYRFSWAWTVTGITSTITATVKVTAVDKQLNQTIKEVDISLNP